MKKNGLHKGNTGSQTLDQGLLPKWVDSYVHVCIRIHLKLVQIIVIFFHFKNRGCNGWLLVNQQC